MGTWWITAWLIMEGPLVLHALREEHDEHDENAGTHPNEASVQQQRQALSGLWAACKAAPLKGHNE